MIKIIDKKLIVRRIWYICLVLIIVQFLVEVFLGLEILTYDINASIITLVLVLIALLLPTYFFDYSKNKVEKKTYLVFTIIVVMFILLLYMAVFSSSKYFYFNSPYEDSKRVLVIEEKSRWTSGQSYFYERKYGIFIKRINGQINYKVGPFSTGTATIKWIDENKVQLDYIYNTKGIQKTEIIKFDE
ncbi:hypothetical protein [Clostridium sp.]|uniref:hypothetical protein n=1 Tax=Clostridium sp. TaxID=1506 RepID=UPI00261D21A6|nr:hypothetical protein [Clostridium sp.]